MAEDMTYEDAQDVVDQGDEVTNSELQEMHPDKTMDQINYDINREHLEEELNHKIEQKYEFNEPRARAKQGRKTCHTGPKGVLTDFEEAKLKMRARRIDDKIEREKKVYMNIGNDLDETAYRLQVIDLNTIKPTAKELRTEHKSESNEPTETVDSDDALEDEEEDIDEELLAQYKQHKLNVMEATRPRFGNTMEVTAWTFEKEIERAPKNIWVVVHVYQDYMERCARMNYCIAQVAKAYPHIKFMRARSDRLGLDNYPEVGLPTFIVFRNGEQLQNHIAVHTQIGNPFDVKDVEAFLIQHKVIQPVVVIPDLHDIQNEKRNAERQRLQSSNIDIKNNAAHSKRTVDDDDSDSELDID